MLFDTCSNGDVGLRASDNGEARIRTIYQLNVLQESAERRSLQAAL